MDERRHLARKYLIIYSRVFERTMGKLLGYLADLSFEGAMIITEEALVEGDFLPLRFDLPDPKEFNSNTLNVTARVARCNPDISPAFYNIGLEFQDLTDKDKRILQKMMEMYEFHREK
jgi:hypothetical protein